MAKAADPPLCPSGAAEQKGARVFAVAGGSEGGAAAYLDRTVAVDDTVLALAAPLSPANVFRVAVPCANGACAHFEHGACQIAARLTRVLDDVADELPRCAIRPACRWWRQEGPAACRRCPAIATTPLAPKPAELIVAGEAGGGTAT